MMDSKTDEPDFENVNSEEERTAKNVKQRYKCDFEGCDKEFSRLIRLKRHTNLHFNMRPYKCTVEKCDKAYTNSSHLRRHLQTHATKIKMYKCRICSSNLSTLSNLKRHYKRAHDPNREMFCHECNVRFRKKSRYEEHKSSHNNLIPYKCDKCGKGFSTNSKFDRHQKTHKIKTYKCSVETCSKVFDKWATLVNHNNLEHVTGEYACSECNKVFKNKTTFKYHKKIHDENRVAIPCPYKNCFRLYYFKRNLSHHVRVKHIENKFRCDSCELKLSTKQKLDNHVLRIHRSEKTPIKRKVARRRKDAGIPKKSMLSKLIGICLPYHVEKELMIRTPEALLRDKSLKDGSPTEDDEISDISAEGA